jgi:CRP-like cAMP-binding protein
MTIQNLESVLSEHPFFAGLDAKYMQLLAGCASNAVFRAGEYLMREGEPANHFYIVRHGKIAIELNAPGAGTIPIHTVNEGSVLGWSWLIPPHQWRFDGRAVELTRVLALDGACLRGKCEDDHDLGYELLKRFSAVVAERLKDTRLQLIDMYSHNAQS